MNANTRSIHAALAPLFHEQDAALCRAVGLHEEPEQDAYIVNPLPAVHAMTRAEMVEELAALGITELGMTRKQAKNATAADLTNALLQARTGDSFELRALRFSNR